MVVTCRPGQYQAVLRLAETAAASALCLAATGSARQLRSARLAQEALTDESASASSNVGDDGDRFDVDSVSSEAASDVGSGSGSEVEAIGAVPTAKSSVPASLVVVAFSLSAPEMKVTILSPKIVRTAANSDPANPSRVCPLLELRTARIAVAGVTPGAATLTVDDCSVYCWPSQFAPLQRSGLKEATFTGGVALFGLADDAPLADDDDDDDVSVGVRFPSSLASVDAGSPAADPLLRVDFSTFPGRYGLADVLAQVRPVFLFTSPPVIDAILQFTSVGTAAGPVAALPSDEALQYPLPVSLGGHRPPPRRARCSATCPSSSFRGTCRVCCASTATAAPDPPSSFL